MMDVYCLCAAWCGSCRTIKPELEGLSTDEFHLYWVDIEDHADALGDVEILAFPTIVVTNTQGKIHYVGSIEPRLSHLKRLLHAIDTRVSGLRKYQDWEDFVCAIRRSGEFRPNPVPTRV